MTSSHFSYVWISFKTKSLGFLFKKLNQFSWAWLELRTLRLSLVVSETRLVQNLIPCFANKSPLRPTPPGLSTLSSNSFLVMVELLVLMSLHSLFDSFEPVLQFVPLSFSCSVELLFSCGDFLLECIEFQLLFFEELLEMVSNLHFPLLRVFFQFFFLLFPILKIL